MEQLELFQKLMRVGNKLEKAHPIIERDNNLMRM
jgi:hypothetical protein